MRAPRPFGEVVVHTASDRKPVANGVSKKMLVAIILLLLLIIVPFMVVGAPLSKIVVEIENACVDDVSGYVDISGVPSDFRSVNLMPGQDTEFTVSVHMGTFEVYVHYWVQDGYPYYSNSRYEEVSVGFMDTGRISIVLT